MVGINVNTSDLREGDAPGPFYRRFDQLPVSFLVLGTSPTWINWALGALGFLALFTLGRISSFFVTLGFSADSASTMAFLCLILCFVSRPVVAFVIRRIRARQIHISSDQVIIEHPNNPFAKDLTTPLREYRGLCRRWGTRSEGRNTITQEILELLHMDASRTIAVRVTEDHTSDPDDIAAIADQLDVDYLADGFKKKSVTAEAPIAKPRAQSVPSAPKPLAPPPAGVRVENRAGASMFGTRLAQDFPWNIFWVRIIFSLISASAVVAGWLLSSNFLMAMGTMLFLPVAWRTIVGSPGVTSILVEGNSIHLEQDNDCLLGQLSGRSETAKTIHMTDVRDVFTRQRQDGKSHELILQTVTQEISVRIPLSTVGLNWVRDFVKQKLH